MIKVLEKVGSEGTYLNIKVYIWLTHSSHIFNEVRLGTIPLKAGMKLGCPLSTFLFNIVLEALDGTIKRRKLNEYT